MKPFNKTQRPRQPLNKGKFQKKKFEPSFDQLMRAFKKKAEKSGIIKECRDREFYEKPAAKRRRKKNEQVRRAQKALRMERTKFNRGRLGNVR
jgi:small subunit ribosomal protein S21|tara:strand:- start:451 stop:729 length:279 start_codon:yes stop_codon:yes gene_type:complete